MPWKRLEGQAIVCALRGKRDRMRLFLRDHVGFMIFQLIQCVMIPVLFWIRWLSRDECQFVRYFSIVRIFNSISHLSIY